MAPKSLLFDLVLSVSTVVQKRRHGLNSMLQLRSVTLTHPVKDDWFVGNEIIIAATGDITNFHRSEKMEIAAVSADGYTVTLTKPLEHRHIAVCNNGPGNNGFGFGWAGEICMRAEVGLLSRNIVFTGDKNHLKDLAECELGAGLAMGVQTCFQNRYGHEVLFC